MSDVRWEPDPDKCHERVYIREQLRYTGRGKGGFERHYNERQCNRKAQFGNYCWQHRKKA